MPASRDQKQEDARGRMEVGVSRSMGGCKARGVEFNHSSSLRPGDIRVPGLGRMVPFIRRAYLTASRRAKERPVLRPSPRISTTTSNTASTLQESLCLSWGLNLLLLRTPLSWLTDSWDSRPFTVIARTVSIRSDVPRGTSPSNMPIVVPFW